MKDIEIFVERLKNFYYDVRTEVIASELLLEGVVPEEIISVHNGQHKRTFRNDLDEVALEIPRPNQKQIVFKLNRDSIYDSLPESLFHFRAAGKQKGTVKGMIDDYKKRKAEEKEARSFFTPFESEFFLQKAFIEQKEKEMIVNASKNLLDDSFLSFLNIDYSLPSLLVAKFTSLLPYLDKIAGNLPITFKSLELILEEKVNYITKFAEKQKSESCFSKLGQAKIGIDFVVGDSYDDTLPFIECNIGPLKKKDLLKYMEGGDYSKFIEMFFNFFIPVSYEVKTIVTIESQEQQFALLENYESSRLGFTTTI